MITSVVEYLHAIEWFFFFYFATLQLIYFGLNVLTLTRLRTQTRALPIAGLPSVYSGLEPPLSVIVPCYNGAEGVLHTLASLRTQDHPQFEIIVVNDGSDDDTMPLLQEQLNLRPHAQAPSAQLPCEPTRALYRAEAWPNLLIVDKENGGKADALNAGINYAAYDLVCMVDSDSLLASYSLRHALRPFMDDPKTIAAGASLMVSNGCRLDDAGVIVRTDLPSNYWVLIQALEYVRAYLMGRLGWARLEAVPLISGAFGVFSKPHLIRAGGYRIDVRAMGEDLELTLRLHRHMRRRRQPYHISYVGQPLCWTRVPTSAKSLRLQRTRWHHALSEGLAMNRGLLRQGGVAGWVVLPFLIFFEWLTPVVELAGYFYVAAAFVLGFLSWTALVAFLVLALGVGALLSMTCLLLEEMAFRSFHRYRDLLVLLVLSIFENLGYRQLHAVWRFTGLLRWIRRPSTSLQRQW